MHFRKDSLVIEYCKSKKIELKDTIVCSYTPLVKYIARKLSFDKNDIDDLTQVGIIGLLRALERFDPKKDIDFTTFATPNIIGEIKHYFRDKRNILKIPRRLQELYSKIKKHIMEAQAENKQLSVPEIAELLGVTEERVLEALEAKQKTSVISLNTPVYNTGGGRFNSDSQALIDNIGAVYKEDDFFNFFSLKEALQKLDQREKKIIHLRFYGGLSQIEIARQMNLSQMHISRIITKALKRLRKTLEQQ
ncbi:MAG: sigma-70 family RNA polymerase sigma factor [bacterium]|nr:sigma-70 family RNA polymerase sigma factor [bacterium]